MKILSLFDGVGCGHLALRRAGIQIDSYDAYEIDKDAIDTAQFNFPDIVQHGDVAKEDFAKYCGKVDLIIGGSPCQGFSQLGKQLNFNDPRSKLFFEFIRALKESKPRYFLLENVVMKKEWKDIISSYLGVKPIEINSSLFSAQNRRRLYWTNIPFYKNIQDKRIKLQDILENNLSNAPEVNLSNCVINGIRGVVEKYGFLPQMFNPYNRSWIKDKAPTLSTGSMITSSCAVLIFENHNNGNFIVKNNHIIIGNEKFLTSLQNGRYILRRLTLVEAKRLQTIPDDFMFTVGDTKAFKMLGNGWTIDVIAHILSGLEGLDE